MNYHAFEFQNETLHAMASGALHWPARKTLCVSDLHFGKAQRYALSGASALPPYETLDTLMRLDQDISETQAETVICLGDSFDRITASHDMHQDAKDWITRLQAGRRWVWIEGNHDPGPIELAGTHLAEFMNDPIVFRHIAEREGEGEVSGHYHPKLSLSLGGRRVTKRCFLTDSQRLILPAYGTYTGGLSALCEPLFTLLSPNTLCIMNDGKNVYPVPRPAKA